MTTKTILPRHYSDEEMKSQYARVAWFYDSWGKITVDKALNRLLSLAAVHDGMSILEVAVGTGRLFERLVKYNPTGVNEGMDLSPAMLEQILHQPAIDCRKAVLMNCPMNQNISICCSIPLCWICFPWMTTHACWGNYCACLNRVANWRLLILTMGRTGVIACGHGLPNTFLHC